MKEINDKLNRYGADSLSDFELLSLICGDQLEAKKIIDEYQNLGELGGDNFFAIAERSGVSRKIAKRINLCMEAGRRYQTSNLNYSEPITSPQSAAAFVRPFLSNLKVEKFMVLFMDNQKQVTSHTMISSGGSTATVVEVAHVVREAVVRSANSIILAHNHPSGYAKPSTADIKLTKRINESCETLGVPVDDHIIIANDQFVSMRNLNLL